mmetsp:Transcript_21418/g.52419  ORF Transcript_21418/g.52419 Transcript_21418/m.52419 type:complete len:126 (-) Transcript_21418:116-493(-)
MYVCVCIGGNIQSGGIRQNLWMYANACSEQLCHHVHTLREKEIRADGDKDGINAGKTPTRMDARVARMKTKRTKRRHERQIPHFHPSNPGPSIHTQERVTSRHVPSRVRPSVHRVSPRLDTSRAD